MKLTGKTREEQIRLFTPVCPTRIQRLNAECFVDLCAERGIEDTNAPSSEEWVALTSEAQRRAGESL